MRGSAAISNIGNNYGVRYMKCPHMYLHTITLQESDRADICESSLVSLVKKRDHFLQVTGNEIP